MKKPNNIKISGKADKMNVKIPNKQIYTIIPTMYKMHIYLGKSISSRWKNDFNFFIVHLKLQNLLIIRMHRVKHKSKRNKVFSKTLINKPQMQNTNKNLFFFLLGGGHRANNTERKNGHILLPKELQNFYAYLIIQDYHLYLFFSLILDEFEILLKF